MKLSVLGCGRWGTFLASYHCAKNEVLLWGRPGSRGLAQLRAERKNEYQVLPESLLLGDDLGAALDFGRWWSFPSAPSSCGSLLHKFSSTM